LPAVPVFTTSRIGGTGMPRSASGNDSDAQSGVDAMEFVFENRNSKVAMAESDDEDAVITQEDG